MVVVVGGEEGISDLLETGGGGRERDGVDFSYIRNWGPEGRVGVTWVCVCGWWWWWSQIYQRRGEGRGGEVRWGVGGISDISESGEGERGRGGSGGGWGMDLTYIRDEAQRGDWG